tara:strand:- start:1985 stop:2575 length:591 start_codon:yes stop_codon:yes gene_type:complete
MPINDINSKRKLSFQGNGWDVGEIKLEYIGRYSCSSAILDEEDFEIEEGELEVDNQYLSFSNTMSVVLKNFDTNNEELYSFKDLKKLGIYRGDINPEDLCLTNSFVKTPGLKQIDHIKYEDEDYYLEFVDSWRGIYREYIFEKGEEIDFKKLIISVSKLDTFQSIYEWVCQVEFEGKDDFGGFSNIGSRIKRLRVH